MFNEELDSFYAKIPRNEERLTGQDINLNVGTFSGKFPDVLGTNGIDKQNSKVKSLLFLLEYNKFRLLISCFKHDKFVT